MNKTQNEVVIFEKTVYRLKAILNQERLTKKGHFDLQFIGALRVIDNGFLKKLREDHNKTQKELAYLTKVPLRTWMGWEYYKKAIPLEKLILLSRVLKLDKDTLYESIRNCEFTLGEHHGKNRMKLPSTHSEFSLLPYLIPQKYNKTYVVKNCPLKIKKRILEKFSIDRCYYDKKGLIVIQSHLLHKFLTTFYIYKKETILQLPLSAEVPAWIDKGADLKSVILPLLLSDGGEKPNNRLYVSGESSIIHKIWTDAWYYNYGLLPSYYKLTHGPIFVTEHRVPESILNELHKICPTFKKSPVNTTVENYLRGPQPTISYLFGRPKIEQQIAIRLWANTEGSIGVTFDKKTNLITPSFQIACAHPVLSRELQKLCKLNEITTSVVKEDTKWSGYSKLRTYSVNSVLEFLRIGGFIRGTKIASRSRYFHDLDKQEVLLGTLEVMEKQRKDTKYRTPDKQTACKQIRNIVLKELFQNEAHYLKTFERHDNWSFRRS